MTSNDLKIASHEYVDHKWRIGCDKRLFVIFKDPKSDRNLQRVIGTIQSLKYKGRHLPSSVPVFVIWVLKDMVETSCIVQESNFENATRTNHNFRPFDPKKVDTLMRSKQKGQWLRSLIGYPPEPMDESDPSDHANNQSVTTIDTPTSNTLNPITNLIGDASESLDVNDMRDYLTPTKQGSASSSSQCDESQAGSSGFGSGPLSPLIPLPKHLAGPPTSTSSSRSASSKGTYNIHIYYLLYLFYEF